MSVQEVSHLKLKLLIILRFPSKAKDCAPLIKMAKLVEQHSFLRTVGLGPEAKTASQMDEGNRSTRIMQTLWDFGHVLMMKVFTAKKCLAASAKRQTTCPPSRVIPSQYRMWSTVSLT